MDRRGDSGQIEFYEEPILYRCGISVRIISTFSSANQRTPDQVKISVQTDRLGLCVSETQLPMLVRLIQESFFKFNYIKKIKFQLFGDHLTPNYDFAKIFYLKNFS